MTLLDAANFYIAANVLLLVAAVMLAVLRAVSPQLAHPVPYRHQLRFGRAIVCAALLLPLIPWLPGPDNVLPQTAQVWSAPSMNSEWPKQLASPAVISFTADSTPMPLAVATRSTLLLLAGGITLLLLRLTLDAWVTLRIVRQAHTLRRRGHLRVLASDDVAIPFSWWLPAQCFIVVPCALAQRSDGMKLVVRHEGQHHRQLDTRLVYLQQLLRALFFWNPAAHVLSRSLFELQEFACDEALGGRRNIDAYEYCRCLLQVAESAAPRHAGLLQVGMADRISGGVLKRRIEAVLWRPKRYSRPSSMLLASAAVTALMAMTAYAFDTAIHDRRITLEDAQRMADVAGPDSVIPIDVNDRVLEQLNLLLATPDGRTFLRAGLKRMQEYEPLIAAQLRQRQLPLELLAIPLVESGYRNLPQVADTRHGAGLWMFIAPTARNYGLTVQEDRDDRLDVAAETRAAMDMFADLHARFGDWRLAVLAYNAGNARVEQGIRATQSRDAWELLANGHHADAFYGDAQYLPRVIATILILKNPSVLNHAG